MTSVTILSMRGAPGGAPFLGLMTSLGNGAMNSSLTTENYVIINICVSGHGKYWCYDHLFLTSLIGNSCKFICVGFSIKTIFSFKIIGPLGICIIHG